MHAIILSLLTSGPHLGFAIERRAQLMRLAFSVIDSNKLGIDFFLDQNAAAAEQTSP